MNKRRGKTKVSSRKLIALLLCFVCLAAALPGFATAAEAGAAQTEATVTVKPTENATTEPETAAPAKAGESAAPAEKPEAGAPTEAPKTAEQPEGSTVPAGESIVPAEEQEDAGQTEESAAPAGEQEDAEQPEETTEPAEEPKEAEETEDDAEKSDADKLYERLMAYETLDELNAAIEALTEEEQALLDQFTEEQNAALEAKMSALGGYGVATLDTYSYTIPQGESKIVSTSNSINSGSLSSECDPEVDITATRRNSDSYTIKVGNVPAGTYTLTVRYKSGGFIGIGTSSHTDTITIIVTAVQIPVHVYVSSKDSSGNSWKDNEEFQDLIGLYVCDTNGYYPAGTIYLDASYFNGKSNFDTAGAGLINSANDWTTLLGLLSGMDNSNLSGSLGASWASNNKTLDFSNNNGNSVSNYLSQAEEIYNQVWGSSHTALFRWHHNVDPTDAGYAHLGHPGDTTTKYHLDLCFNTNKITFICGNNGITESISTAAADGTVVDSRVYITGSAIQEPRNLQIPNGYQLMGYYTDPNFNTPWNGIGTPLTKDQTVYIKITEMANAVLNYKVADGEGTVTPADEAFNPVRGTPAGSTAAPADGWAFDGWYADEACTEKLSSDLTFVPTAPKDGWKSGTTYTYWAKFVKADAQLTVKKTLSGNMYNENDKFTFTVTYGNGDNDKAIFELGNGSSNTISVPIGATITITEATGGYTPSASLVAPSGLKFTETKNADDTYSISFTMPQDNVSVVFNNEKSVIVDTGVMLDTLPYVLILAAVTVGGTALIKRRRYED